MKRICLIVLALLCAGLLSFPFASCASTGGGSPIVGFVDAQFEGVARSDGQLMLVRGAFKGSVGLRSKYGGMPLTVPMETAKDEWALIDLLHGKSWRGHLGVDLIPLAARSLFAPGELGDQDSLFEKPKEVAPPVVTPPPAVDPEPAPST